MAQQVEAIANTLLELGRIKGQGAANQGQIWGNTLAGLGQIPQQIQQAKAQQQEMGLRSQEMQIRQMQVGAQQRQQAAEDALNNAYSNALNPDGSIDMDRLTQHIAGTPAASQLPKIQAGLASVQEKQLQVSKLRGEVASAERDHMAAVANAADAGTDPETKAATLLVGVASGIKSGAISPEAGHPIIAQILSQAGTPDPEAVTRTIARMKALSAADVEKRAVATKDLAEAAKAGNPIGPRPITNQTELELAASDVNHPMHAAAVTALADQRDAKNKAPTETAAAMDARAQALYTKLNLGQKLTPPEAAELKAYEKRKTLVPSTTFNLNAPTRDATRNDARSDRNYTANAAKLDKARGTVSEQVNRLNRLNTTLDQQTPQADALLAPELLTVMAGGAGSGLRMNEAEISRVVGGRSNLESLKAALNKWSLDPSKALSVTPAQRSQMRSLIRNVGAQARQKLGILAKASNDLIDAGSVDEQRRIAQGALQGIDEVSEGDTSTPATGSALDILKARRKALGQ